MVTVESARYALMGPVASVSIPFNGDGSVDIPSLKRIVDFIILSGSGTVLLTYGDSLYSLLTDREIARITQIVVE